MNVVAVQKERNQMERSCGKVLSYTFVSMTGDNNLQLTKRVNMRHEQQDQKCIFSEFAFRRAAWIAGETAAAAAVSP